jgi:ribosomal subunit interface protein
MIKHHIKHTNMELTEAIADYLEKKLKAFEKFVDESVEGIARVEVGRTSNHHHKGDVFRAEIDLEFGHQKFHASVEADDLYRAIDEVKDEIVQEITRASKKRRHLVRRGAQKIKDILKRFKRD